MKKLCALLLATVTVLSLVSCGNGYSKKEVAEYINVTDYKSGLVSKSDYEEEFEKQLQSFKDSYCAPVEVAGETQVKDGHIVNATYEAILEVLSVAEPVEIEIGKNTIVSGDRNADKASNPATKTFDDQLIGLTITEEGKEKKITYTFSSSYGKDADGKDTAEKYLRNKQITVSVKIIEIDGKTDKETKIADGSKVKLTYTIKTKLSEFSGTKKDITVGEKLGDVISLDDVLKALKTPKKENKKEDNKDSSSSSTSTAVDYKLSFEKKDITLEGEKLTEEFLKGKKASITGTVHIVKEKPEFTDKLVKEKSEGAYETIKDLEKSLTDSVAANLAMEKLVEKSKMKKDLPKGDVKEAYENVEKNMKNYYVMFTQQACLSDAELASFLYTYGAYFGISLTQGTPEAMTQYFAAQAAYSVKQAMLLYYVAEAEGLEVTDKEYDAYVKEQAKASKVSKREFVKNYGGKDAILEGMLFTEVSEFLRDQVKAQLSL